MFPEKHATVQTFFRKPIWQIRSQAIEPFGVFAVVLPALPAAGCLPELSHGKRLGNRLGHGG
jgi:hypothetical protein